MLQLANLYCVGNTQQFFSKITKKKEGQTFSIFHTHTNTLTEAEANALQLKCSLSVGVDFVLFSFSYPSLFLLPLSPSLSVSPCLSALFCQLSLLNYFDYVIVVVAIVVAASYVLEFM